ncbi:MAG: DNA repair protein RecN [Bacteroidetes bacterium]|nr:MAG: DNA repair protein RecN [Bacteroidota bacterium]
MIKNLLIKNYAIIESLEINFPDGLTIITGETGAGKSILLGALGLILGQRADSKVLYEEGKKCVVEGVFDVSEYGLKAFLESNEIDYDDEMIVRREISPSGKSRAFVNDTPVNLNILKTLSAALIDLHHQFDTLDIHRQDFQMKMLDALAGNKKLLKDYQSEYRDFQKAKKQLEEIQLLAAQSARELEFVNFQLTELHEAELIEGEQEKLENELSQLTHAEEVKKNLLASMQQLFEDEQSVSTQLAEIGNLLTTSGKVNAGVQGIAGRFLAVTEELNDIGREIERLAENTEYDEARIVESQERLDIIYRLEQKHSVKTLEALLEIQNDLEKKSASFANQSQEEERLEKQILQHEKSLMVKAGKLQDKRRKIIEPFEKKVLGLLGQLAMPQAQFSINLNDTGHLGPSGLDEANFLFSANKGGALQKIREVASGGELARLSLVTKSLVASAIPLPTLIFDEIDTGISGDVAIKMGEILRQLSNEHQVVSITHSPQIASKADAHYFVYKKDTEERTIARVRLLDDDEKVRAIAVMLSQNPPSDAAMQNARDLLGAK